MAMDGKETKREARVEGSVPGGPAEQKRQGRFQPFRRLFGRRRRRGAEGELEEGQLKPSLSTGDVSHGATLDHQEANQHLRELNHLESRAFSHESVFIPEASAVEPSTEQTMSQENVSDKVRSLQRQIAQSIKFGQRPPSLRRSEGDEGSSDEEEVPRSPLKVMAQVETAPAEGDTKEQAQSTSEGVTHHGTPLKSPRTKRPPPPGTIESVNLDAVPQSVMRLDNAAAKHKLSVKPKNQRMSRKHRRFTQDLQEVSLADIMHEDMAAPDQADGSGVSRADSVRSRGSRESPEISKKQRLQEEEQERLELHRKREQEEQMRKEEEKRRAEQQRLAELERLQRAEEARRQREEMEKKAQEEEEKKRREGEEQLRRQEEQKRRQEEEERKRREEEERRRFEEERRQLEIEAERLRLEEERKREAEEEDRRQKEEAEKLRLFELEEKRRKEEEDRLRKEEEEWRRRYEEEAEMKQLAEMERKKEEEERAAEEQHRAVDPEWKRRAEEMRWREMEERQRPFTFKVSSGEKQILFQKVNLTPVTPTSSQQGATAENREGAKASADSPTLSSSMYVPHTAILVTGAQLCGTAVKLDQIKDTACKSLLGLSEDKKALGTPPTKSKSSPERRTGKTKSLSESSYSTDQSSAAVLAEWASIRSKIFKGAEDGKYQEYPDQGRKPSQSRPTSEDLNQVPFSHANLRKTMSASAKFSITPARKKFADSNRNSEIIGQQDREGGREDSPSPEDACVQPVMSPSSASKTPNRISKTVRIADSAEECMFAKDLPSFLVPSPGSPKSQGSEIETLSQAESEDTDAKEDGDQNDESGEDRPSPFGIKLRRTNYSLRFNNEHPSERRKKRYSAGDSFDGVPAPLTPINPDSDSPSASERSSPTSPLRESVAVKPPAVESWCKQRSTLPAARSESDKLGSKPPVYQRPSAIHKSSDSVTPPPSPLPKPSRGTIRDSATQRPAGGERLASEERGNSKEDPSAPVQALKGGQGEDEPKEKKSFFPSISIPWREKTDRRTELIRRDKPSLQSRHSLDSSRVQEKEAGPLWVTLALQKQKGFREQQQSREDRKLQREAKLAEKQVRVRDNASVVSPIETKAGGTSTPPKAPTPEESKRPDTLLGRFERRDNLKKSNTLPSSVTVEIADSTPSPPATKELPKRIPPGESPQVSTEPAWLALAKRKAKAWSDCPQIIK